MSRRRSKTLPLSPKWLPLIVQRLHSNALSVNTLSRRLLDANGQEFMRDYGWVARDLPKARLWWVTADMTALAVNTAEDREGFDGSSEVTMPSDQGFIVWDEGLPIRVGQPPMFGVSQVQVDAMFWDWIDGKMYYQLFTADRRMVAAQAAFLDHVPLVPAETPRISHSEQEFLTRILAATWALSSQPTVAESRNGAWDERKDGVKPRAVAKAPVSEVKFVYLRENRTSPRGDDPDSPESSREYSCRWVVRGFYRNQPYGPKRSLRRKQWIPPYVKGPADKPLKLKTTVHIWRR